MSRAGSIAAGQRAGDPPPKPDASRLAGFGEGGG